MPLSKSAARATLACCLTAFFLGFAKFYMGISLADNTWELHSGTTAHLSDFFYLQYWSPLYYHWFKLLAFVWPNPIADYFLSWGILAAALALTPVLLKVPRAWVYTVIVAVLPFLTVTPFLGMFGSIFILAGLCIVLRQEKTPAYAATAACVTSFLVCFARPEFDYGVFLSALATLFILLQTRAHTGESASPARRLSNRTALGYAALVVLLAGTMFAIMKHSRFERSGMAFSQHYLWRDLDDGKISRQAATDDYAVQAFGVHSELPNFGSLSAFDFLRANPRLFAGHMLGNLRDYRTWSLIACLLAALAWPWLRPARQDLRTASIFLALASLPPLFGMITIYPREHYIILIAPSLLLFVLQMLPSSPAVRLPLPLIFVVACAMIVYVQLRVQPRRTPLQDERRDLRREQCVRAADLPLPNQTQPVFDGAGVGDVYIAHPRTFVTPSTVTDWNGFQSFATQTKPLWITADKRLLERYAITQPQLDSFLQHDLGYHIYPCQRAAVLSLYMR